MELLVVIAIIGILVALLLPAIQAARETARRSQCKNNLKQLALGCLNHFDVQKFFPTGGWGYQWVGDPDRGFGIDQPGGWVYSTLPFIEESALHDSASDGRPDALTPGQTAATKELLGNPITIINCPSMRRTSSFSYNNPSGTGIFNSQLPTLTGRSDYSISSGTVLSEFGPGPNNYPQAETWHVTKAWPVQTAVSRPWLNGVSHQLSKVTISQVEDGTSKTYLIGEKYVSSSNYETGADIGDNESSCTGSNNDNYRVSGVRLSVGGPVVGLPPLQHYPNEPGNVPPGLPTATADPSWPPLSTRTYGSAHSAGFHASLCDGSVTFIAYDVDLDVHRDYGDRNDGNVHDGI